MHVVIFAGGTVQTGRAMMTALAQADLIIAADSGAETALSQGYVPALVVGDFDSLHMSTRPGGAGMSPCASRR